MSDELRIDRPFTAEEITKALDKPDREKFDKLVTTYLDGEALADALEPHMINFYMTDPGIIFTAGIMTALQILEERNRAVNNVSG